MLKSARASILCLALCSAVVGGAFGAETEGWRPLFDGRSLAGFKANLHLDSFSVVDGAIRAHCTSASERSHLFFVGDDPASPPLFANFELTFEAKGEPGANGGVFFHTDEVVRDARKHLANGYEVQLNSSPSEKRKTGSLYGIVDLDESPVDETEWFDVRILVERPRIHVWIGEQQVIDYVEPENPDREASRRGRVLRPQGGAIALQAHDPGSVFYFRNLRVREIVAE